MGKFINYKNPSQIQIEDCTKDTIEDLEFKRGDCFLRDGALCMVVESSNLECPPQQKLEDLIPIINLGTGRVWFIDKGESVKKVKSVKLTFERGEIQS